MAVLALGAIGAGIGSAFGYAAIGWSVGVMAGNYLFPPKMPDQQGPRLGDLKVQSSTYGSPLPIIYGTTRVAGNIIWSTDIQETSHESGGGGGKGGGSEPKQTSYTYSQSFAIALCEGEIVGISRIWANGKLIYNLSSTATAATVSASLGSTVRIYTGSETQIADSLIQAHVGAVDTPAYRGVAYVVFENLQLGDYGNRTPNLEFEVVKNGTANNYVATQYPLSSIGYWYGITSNNSIFCTVGYLSSRVNVSSDGVNWIAGTLPSVNYWYGIAWNGSIFCTGGNGVAATSSDGLNWVQTSAPSSPGPIVWNGSAFCALVKSSNLSMTSGDGVNWITHTIPFTADYVQIAWNGSVFCSVAWASAKAITSTDGANWVERVLPATTYWTGIAWNGSVFCAVAYNTNICATSPDGITWTQHSLPTTAGWRQIAWNGSVFYVVAGAASNIAATSPDGINWVQRTLPVAAGWYGITAKGSIFCAVADAHNSAALIIPQTLTSIPPSLATIASDICTRATLSPSSIDVTALTDTVDGYVVQRGTGRSRIEQLMQAYYFDAVESDGKVKFVKRGGASVVSIPENDLAVHDYGSAPPETLLITRKQEMELPVEIDIQYMDKDAAHAIGTQRSQRLITSSENKASHNLALSLSATKAKQIADVSMYDAWTTRTAFEMYNGWKYSYLEPTDIVTVTKSSRSYTLRLTDEDAAGGVYRRSAVLEDLSIYTQTATAPAISVPSDTVSTTPLTTTLLLDIPLLRDADDTVGFYAAACGAAAGWSGAQAFKSNDGGASWGSFGRAFLNQAAIGVASTVLGNFTGGNIFDETNSVTVVMTNGTLSSDTELNVLNGANVAVVGNELIQFKTATLTATNTYKLTGLLRGQRGTEWAMTTHAVNDRFVVLTATTTYLFDGPSTEYNLLRKYRGVSFGGYLDDATSVDFTHTAVALKPLSPVKLGGGRNAALDVVLTWIRRTRIAGSWNDYVDASLGETTEAYVVEIYDATYVTLKRTITGITTATTTYTAAQQTTDFGGTQATVYFKVYQVSSTVGNGYAGTGVI